MPANDDLDAAEAARKAASAASAASRTRSANKTWAKTRARMRMMQRMQRHTKGPSTGEPRRGTMQKDGADANHYMNKLMSGGDS